MASEPSIHKINYSSINLEELDNVELRALEDHFYKESLKMSGIGPGKQSDKRREVYRKFWNDESIEDLISNTILEVEKVNAVGHCIRGIKGSVKSHKNNRDYTLNLEYECDDGKLKFSSVYTDHEAEYKIESGVTSTKKLLEEISDEFKSPLFWREKVID